MANQKHTVKTIPVTNAHRDAARKMRAIGCPNLEPTGDALESMAAMVAMREYEAAQPKRSMRDRIIERLGEDLARENFPHYF